MLRGDDCGGTETIRVIKRKGPTFVDPFNGSGIRTHEPFPVCAVSMRRFRPLSHPAIFGIDKIYLIPLNECQLSIFGRGVICLTGT